MCVAIAAGNYVAIAARSIGISPETVATWVARGTPGTKRYDEQGPRAAEDPDVYPDDAPEVELRGTPYPGRFALFALAVARAEAEAEIMAVTAVRRGMFTDWRAAADYLRRRHPDRWGDQLRVDEDLHVTGGVEVRADEAWVLGMLEVLERAGGLKSLEAGLADSQTNGNGKPHRRRRAPRAEQ